MEQIITKETMTSLEIAEVTGMRHSDLMRSIRNMEDAWAKVSQRNFALSSYKQGQPNGGAKDVPCFVLTKKGCLILASGYQKHENSMGKSSPTEISVGLIQGCPQFCGDLLCRQIK